MKSLAALIASYGDWLMQWVLQYAKERNYTERTSALTEPWRPSIASLSYPLPSALQIHDGAPELRPDDDYVEDPIASLGVVEARRDRAHGVLDILGRLFGGLRHRLHTALGGQSAMEKLRQKDYDLIMLDYKTSEIGGRKLYGWLEKKETRLTNKVLWATDDTMDPQTQAFLDETRLPHLGKQFDPEEMKSVISRLPASGGEDGERENSRSGR